MTRSARLVAAAFLAALMLPVTALPALASTEVVEAPLPAPTGLAPADPATFPQIVRKDVFLHWNTVDGATGYRVEIGADDTWSDTPAMTGDFTNNGAFVPVGSLPSGTYTWRVAALKGSAVGHWTSEATNSQNAIQFTNAWRAGPTLLAPADGATVAWPDLSWTGVSEASRYAVLVSPNPLSVPASTSKVPEGAFKCETTRTRVTPFDEGKGVCKMTLLPATLYYWTVSAIDVGAAAGQEASFPSGVRKFTTGPAASGSPSGRPTLTSVSSDPDKLCTITNASPERSTCSDVPTIRWSAVTGANHYLVDLSTDSLFGNTIDIIKTKGTSWTSTDGMPELSSTQALYYDVQACDDKDVCSLVSATAPSFRKVTPPLGNLSKPAITGLAVFSWDSLQKVLAGAEKPASSNLATASQDAATYHLQVATSDHPSFDSTVLDRTVDGMVPGAGEFPNTTSPTWFSSGDELGDGKYVWRVQAVDAKGNKLPWSASKAFTRDSTRPSLLSVTPNAKVAVKQPLAVTFSEAVTGVTSSSLTLSPATPATVTVTGPTTATITPTQALVPGGTYSIFAGSAIVDVSGNSAIAEGPSVTVTTLADDTSSAISYTSGWRPFSATNAVGGRYYRSTPTGSFRPSASLTFVGTGVNFYTCLAPTNGYIDVYVDGSLRGRKSLYRSYSGCGIKLYALGKLPKGTHTIKVVGVGSKATASKGTNVAVDAFNVSG